MAPTIREKLVALAYKFAATVNDGDMDASMAIRTENCLTHQCCPSLNTKPLTNNDIRAYFDEWTKIGINSKFSITDERFMVVDDVAKRVSFRAVGSADTIGGPYENDILVILQATDDCALVAEIWEYFDAIIKKELLDRLTAVQAASGLNRYAVSTAPENHGVPSAKIEPKVAA
ncbi:uncharacterized protein BHQ10_009278 [Talaromyces amestolkiae]|uniref:SnoaL-like domain-containing protein n=1 Tax=Talaromyces amestolkiae TaxID=1196081 RepID=A0A364LBR8_TALAM|nr:uncharacterized protein BHQ10_009278 [Talaromyces amestolkiae]RAO73266.1 hypothetical protein BHQ10_009278 [Talaromyces amestolkiae]